MITKTNKSIHAFRHLLQLLDAPYMLVTFYDILYIFHIFLIRLICFLYVILLLFVHWYLP